MPCTKPEVATFSGDDDNLVELFLDNDWETCPYHAMEAAISDQPFQALVVDCFPTLIT